MKLRNDLTMRMAICAVTFSCLSGSALVYAQEDALLADTETVLNSEKIDIDGEWKTPAAPPKKLSNAQLIKRARKKSTRHNIQQISKEIEQIQVSTEQIEDILNKEDKRLQNGVDAAFGGETIQDSVSQKEAAVESVMPAPLPTPIAEPRKKFKLIPTMGVTHISGQAVDFESKTSVGLNFETDISARFAVGIGVNYTSLDVKEIDNNILYNGLPPCTSYGCSGYGQYYGQGRELGYKHFLLEFTGKYFFTAPTTMIRPYFGLGLGYNRTRLEYDDSDSGNNNGGYYNSTHQFRYGDEQFTSSYISGSALLGTEINFTETIGLNLDLKYRKGLSAGFGTESKAQSIYNRDQQKLDRIGKDIEDSNFYSINAGLIVKF